ncbi:hypothetical protein C6Y14_35880 [Streptomyces dioscori]|uniref:Uncharacterized protein n=1 Tax=Streptomyces dioscori TaxID=2109333 RepID=A0A2P8PX18_9ACTN|nr:hypothetical protein [Streptomyces dioscori]PSM38535.1 hypothetical protein C6Y14_35880 [Streptomyces dioscori]
MGLNGVNGVNEGAGGRPDAIRVNIGELVLDGFTVDPDRVSTAFSHELTRLVREHGVPLATGRGAVTLDALSGLPPLPAGLSARRLGQELARAVHAGLSGQGEVQAP